MSCIIAQGIQSKLVLWSGHGVCYYFVKGSGFNFKSHERERGGGRGTGENGRERGKQEKESRGRERVPEGRKK